MSEYLKSSVNAHATNTEEEMENIKKVTSQCLSHSQLFERLVSKIFMKVPVKGQAKSMTGQLQLVEKSYIISDFTRTVVSPPGVNQLNEMVAAERIISLWVRWLWSGATEIQVPVYAEDEELGTIPIGCEVYNIDTDRRQFPVATYDESNHIFILDFTGGNQ